MLCPQIPGYELLRFCSLAEHVREIRDCRHWYTDAIHPSWESPEIPKVLVLHFMSYMAGMRAHQKLSLQIWIAFKQRVSA
ncbi:hypothetical protein D3C78_1908360 [compost metagenome]